MTDQPELTRRFYAEVFGFTLDGNPDLPDFDFTFLRRPTGTRSAASWACRPARGPVVDDVRGRRHRRRAASGRWRPGGTAGPVDDMIYGRFAQITDPFGVEFSVIARP